MKHDDIHPRLTRSWSLAGASKRKLGGASAGATWPSPGAGDDFHIFPYLFHIFVPRGIAMKSCRKKTILLDLMVISLDFRSQQMPKNPCALRQGRMWPSSRRFRKGWRSNCTRSHGLISINGGFPSHGGPPKSSSSHGWPWLSIETTMVTWGTTSNFLRNFMQNFNFPTNP